MKCPIPLTAAVVAVVSCFAHAHDVPPTPEAMTIPDLLDAFGWDADSAEVRTEVVEEGFYVLFGLGGNIAVSSGSDGVLMVDDQYPEMMPKLKEAMRK